MKLIFFRRLLISLLAGAIISALTLLIGALFLSSKDDPTYGAGLISWLALILGAFASGMIMTKGNDDKLIPALVLSATLTAVFFILSHLLARGASAPLKLPVLAISSFTGAMIGSKRRTDRSFARRRKAIRRQYSR